MHYLKLFQLWFSAVLLVRHGVLATLCSDPETCGDVQTIQEKAVIVGNTTYHPSFGMFPKGCKWRYVTEEGSSKVGYQFWNFTSGSWMSSRPADCGVQGYPSDALPEGFEFYRGSPRSEVRPGAAHSVYHNLWYSNGKWYALVDGPNFVPNFRFSRNQEIVTFHVKNATDFTNSVKYRIVPGDTILFDFIFFIHPTAIGHWWEMLGPLYSILKAGQGKFKRPCDQFILLHLQRQHMLEWVRAMIAVALGVKLKQDLPPIFVQEDTDSAWNQITQILEGVGPDEWILFERVLITKDLYTGGGRTFLSVEDAREFRAMVYQQYGLPPPTPRKEIPKVITFQRKRQNRRILNEEEVIELLANYGELQVVEYNSSSSLHQQLIQMTKTGVYVSVHTSNLANSPLLSPGSAVVELIHRNWAANGLDTSFRDQTALMEDIHHFAWRAQHLNQTVYLQPRDLYKVGHWMNKHCMTEECVEAHTKVDLWVDIQELKELLDSRIPLVFAGVSVAEAALPWPEPLDIYVDKEAPPFTDAPRTSDHTEL